MIASLSMVTCPNCGAPHRITAVGRVVLCIYCNTSLLVGRPGLDGGGGEALGVSAQPVAKEDVERVKQLLVDGRRGEAVDLYAQLASVPRPEAETAIDAVVVSSYFALTRDVPINGIGITAYAVLIAAGLGAAGWAAGQALDGAPAWFALTALGLLFAAWLVVSLARHLRSTLVARFGATGRARVLRSAVLREMKQRDCSLVALMFEVTPDDGSAPFVDQENLLVLNASLEKFAVGNVMRVRFNAARSRVFPITPIVVIHRAG
jgi:hypothetical protein